jgi:alkanesulfonate monooxygenase SsuD/methylene tetrahydromethanopterin reductase-like flavin-dependent oxidoreductase (luciferase family)
MSGVLPAVSAIAGATEEIRVGTVVALTPLYEAIRFGEDAATAGCPTRANCPGRRPRT